LPEEGAMILALVAARIDAAARIDLSLWVAMMLENQAGKPSRDTRVRGSSSPRLTASRLTARVRKRAGRRPPQMSLDEVHSFSYPGGGSGQGSQEVARSNQFDPIRLGHGFLN
jgi:hypothetical protein